MGRHRSRVLVDVSDLHKRVHRHNAAINQRLEPAGRRVTPKLMHQEIEDVLDVLYDADRLCAEETGGAQQLRVNAAFLRFIGSINADRYNRPDNDEHG